MPSSANNSNFGLHWRQGRGTIVNYNGKKYSCATPNFSELSCSEITTQYKNNNQIDELLDKLEEFGYSVDDSDTHPHSYQILEPYDTPHKLNVELIQFIINGSEKLIFIGCPHDFIKKIKFNENSIIIDLWGIVKDKKANVIREI